MNIHPRPCPVCNKEMPPTMFWEKQDYLTLWRCVSCESDYAEVEGFGLQKVWLWTPTEAAILGID